MTDGEFKGEDARWWKTYRIMKEMGWCYEDYLKCPAHLIDKIWAYFQTECKFINDSAEMKKNG